MQKVHTLAEVLSEFAHTLVTDFPIQGILDHLVRRIVDLLPIDAAGVSLISPTTNPRLIAGSDESAVRYENLQTRLGEGPCLAAYETGVAIAIPNLVHDDRFPRFARGALAEGLVAAFTFPLRNDDRRLGALDLYRTTAGSLSQEDMKTAQILADVATAYLLNSEARSAQSNFVATVSHELRTPMTSIAGYVELLQDRDVGPLNQEEHGFLDAIARNGHRLTSLVNHLLTVSSLHNGARSQQMDLDLGTVISAAEDALASAIEARDVGVSFTIPPGPVMVCGNHADLESVVTNLVGNALKFTEDGGWVDCTLRTISGRACVEVSDNGIGIPRDEQRDLFRRFFRSSTAREHAVQGTGLGLTIVDSIVQSHHGDVSVVSEHMNGSTFTVRLPLCAGHCEPSASEEPLDGASAGSTLLTIEQPTKGRWMSPGRDREAVRHLVAAEAVGADDPPAFGGWLQRMCRAAARELPASGVGLSLINDDGSLVTAAASGVTSAVVEELQFTMGEGPCLDAYASRLPVLVSDLSEMAGTYWPGYAPAAQAHGVRAVFAFPLQTGRARLGALDVYRSEPGSLSTPALKLALVFADVAMEGFLESRGDGQQRSEGAVEHGINRYEVYQAQGMVGIKLEVTMEEALLRLRAHAFASGERLSKVAEDVINRRLVLDRDS